MDEAEVEDPQSDLETLDPISLWCSSINRASEDRHACNRIASSSFAGDAGWRSSVSTWLSAIDSVSDTSSDRDISGFVTDLVERNRGSDVEGDDSVEIEGLQEIGEPSVECRVGGLRIVEFGSESDEEDGDVDVRASGDDCVSTRFWSDAEMAMFEMFEREEVDETAFEWATSRNAVEDGGTEPVRLTAQPEADYLWWLNRSSPNVRSERNIGDSGAADSRFLDEGDNVFPNGELANFEELLGQLFGGANAPTGSPPAAKSAVESLLSVELTVEELRNDDAACAVCRDKISAEEEVKRLPCCHYFHGDCVVPWLVIRNTCPVCRYELPTDDPDYEQRKSPGAHRGPSMNS